MQVPISEVNLITKFYPLYAKLKRREQKILLKKYKWSKRQIKFEFDETTKLSNHFINEQVLITISLISLSPKAKFILRKIRKIVLKVSNYFDCFVDSNEIRYYFDGALFDMHQFCFLLIEAIYRYYLSSNVPDESFLRSVCYSEMALFHRYEKQENIFWDNLCQKVKETDPLKWFASASEMYFFHFDKLEQVDNDMYQMLETFWNARLLKGIKIKQETRSAASLHPVYSVYTLISFFVGSFILLYLVQNVFLNTWFIAISVAFLSSSGFIVKRFFENYKIPYITIPFIFFSIFGLGVVSFNALLITNNCFAYNEPEKVVVLPYTYAKYLSRREINPQTTDYIYSYEFSPYVRRQIVFESQHFRKAKYFIIIVKKGIWNINFLSKSFVIYSSE